MPGTTDAPALSALRALSSEALLAFLAKQRWFAAKGASPASARVRDAVVLPWGNGDFAIARIGVTVGGAEHVYQLPFSSRDSENFDAVADEEFRRGLVDALSGSAVGETDGVRWIAESIAAIDLDGATRVGSTEQSNTSIVVGDRAIIKLFRTLRVGVHPDVELTRFLTTRAHFPNTPRLLGDARFEDANGSTVAAMMQELVAGASDAWSYALERGKRYFDAPASQRDPVNDFIGDARRLGQITRALHDALASDDDDPAFAADPIGPEDLDRWAHRVQHMIRESLGLLENALANKTLPNERVAEAQALVKRRDHYLGWIDEIDDTLGDDIGMRIRVHGDYHLGQVLRTAKTHAAGLRPEARGAEGRSNVVSDFMVIDFEGEPSRSLDERREKTSPLRDVAGMLRSFAYAAATLAMSAEKSLDVPTRELRAARWERDVRAAYLEGYLMTGEEDESGFLPEETLHVRQLLNLFEAEKAFYELAYELNNRPAWAWIPMRGISKLFL
jgi:maltose alpha-D-glucosyltransferase/alpha-amylase